MEKFNLTPYPFDKKSKFPRKDQIIDSLDKIEVDSKFKNIALFSAKEIECFEKNKKENAKEDLLIRILTSLPSGTVSLGELNTVSAGIQRVYTSLYDTLFGKGNTRGKIPKEIHQSSQLILKATTAGSFKLHIDVQKNNPILESYDETALTQFANLFEELNNPGNYANIADEYGVRTFKILENWFQDLSKADIEFEYTNSKGKNPITLTREKIKNATKELSLIKAREEQDPVIVVGDLVSANSTNNSFIINADGQNIKGKMSTEVFNIGLTINKKYRFILTKKVIVNTASGDQKESYFLNEIQQMDDTM